MPKSGPTRRQATAADLIGPELLRQAGDLRKQEARLRAGKDSAVHRFRIAARRLRSTLSGFEPLLDPQPSREIRSGLRVAAASVAGARDAEVLRERVDRLLATEPPGTDVDEARAQAERLLVGTHRAVSTSHLDSWEYDALVRLLERFSDLPPWTEEARAPADVVLRALVRKEWKRFRAAGKAALPAFAEADRDHRLHEARKAAKRARYVLETVEPAFGRKAARMAQAAGRVQTVLGEHQDSVLAQHLLGEAAREAAAAGEDTFVLGRLHAREAATAADLRQEHLRLHLAADRPALRRWLD